MRSSVLTFSAALLSDHVCSGLSMPGTKKDSSTAAMPPNMSTKINALRPTAAPSSFRHGYPIVDADTIGHHCWLDAVGPLLHRAIAKSYVHQVRVSTARGAGKIARTGVVITGHLTRL